MTLRNAFDALGTETTLQGVKAAVEQIAAKPATQPVSADALPLPAGAATEASVAGIRTDLGTDGASPPAIAGTGVRGWLRAIYDRLTAGIGRTWTASYTTDSVAVSGRGASGSAATGNPVLVGGSDGTNARTILTDASGNLYVKLATTGTVALDAATLAALETISVANFPATQVVSGAVTADTGLLQPLTDAQLRAASIKADVDSQGLTLLRRIAQLLKPLQQITGGGSNRLSVDVNNVVGGTIGTVTTVTGVTTVGTVTNAANVGGVSAFDMMKAMSRQAYNSGTRSRIS